MKIGIMTMHRIKNYGSYLQAYGLKKMCEELGGEVVFVDYKIEDPVDVQGTFKGTALYKVARKIVRFIRKSKRKFLSARKEKIITPFEQFISDFSAKYIPSLGVSKKKCYRTNVDILIIGSDEVFNCTQGQGVGFSRELFGLNNSAKKVISYAASFGNTTFEKLKKYNIADEVGELLNNFYKISVRDKNSEDIVYSLIGEKPELHMDPVLMYDFSKDIIDKHTLKDYIVVYAYNKRITKVEGEKIRAFAEKNHKKLIAISGNQEFCDEYVFSEPLEILSYFKHADYIITDTFHGTIFSIINHKKFATIVRRDENAEGYGNQEKLMYLLESLGLQDRIVTELSEIEKTISRPINYDIIDEILQKERVRTKKYLKSQILCDE